MDHMDMQYFYDVQMHRLESLGHEVVPYEDMICQMWDLLRLGDRTHITLEDFLQPDIIKVASSKTISNYSVRPLFY
jgi:serine/threonine-protein phosphatase 2A regulatory subunit B''